MSNYETVLHHMVLGTTYSWDLTVLVGLGIPVSTPLREKLLRSRTTEAEAADVMAAYAATRSPERASGA